MKNNNKMKNILAVLAALACLLAAFLAAGCGQDGSNKKVAIAFANSSVNWQTNGNAIKDQLEKEGFAVDLQFADTAEQQIDQLGKMIESHPGCIVIGAIDGEKLSEVLAGAKEKNIPVIAYDRLIMNTDAVSYCANFDGEAIGEFMGEYIEAKLDLKNGAGPFNIELFAGSPGDNNAHVFFKESMRVLQPYIDKGQLVVPSGETSFEKVAIADWKPENAKARMEKLLAGPDAGVHLDAILAPNDGSSAALREVLAGHGYGQMPLMTGLDGEDGAIQAIKEGKQSMTIAKDPAILTDKTIRMIKAVVEGTRPDINNIDSYNNGVITVPAYMCTPLIIDAENVNNVK